MTGTVVHFWRTADFRCRILLRTVIVMYESRFNNITGVILVGGKSRRMGTDKAFLDVCGKPLFERVLDLFRESFAQTILVGDRDERFAGYGLRVVPDIYPGSALGGLFTGLSYAETGHVFAAPCDMIYPNRELMSHICSLKEDFDIVVPETARGFEPLFALYSKRCLDPMLGLLERGIYRIIDFYPQVRVRNVTGRELDSFDCKGKSFTNINSPEDLLLAGKECDA
jgi:molybdopterin-guanine dinucleotide biosynthesis protein A